MAIYKAPRVKEPTRRLPNSAVSKVSGRVLREKKRKNKENVWQAELKDKLDGA